MIISLWAIPTVFYVTPSSNVRTTYVPSLGSCAPLRDGFELDFILIMAVYLTFSLLTITSAVYLRHKIIHIKAYICELQRCGMDKGKLSKSQRLKELLKEQVKPTIGVFVVGGIDALGVLLNGMIIIFLRVFTTPIEQFQFYQIIIVPLFFLQSLSHSLSFGFYNKTIRDEMHPCYPKRSRVIVLNR